MTNEANNRCFLFVFLKSGIQLASVWLDLPMWSPERSQCKWKEGGHYLSRNDCIILSLVKKNHLTSSTEVRNCLENLRRIVQIKISLHECELRRFLQKGSKSSRRIQEREKQPMCWSQIVWTEETQITSHQNDGRRKTYRGKVNSEANQTMCETWGRQRYDT